MSASRERRVCIKFCFKLGKTATAAHDMLQAAFGEDSLSERQIYRCFQDSEMDRIPWKVKDVVDGHP
jgi:hypothetical protein